MNRPVIVLTISIAIMLASAATASAQVVEQGKYVAEASARLINLLDPVGNSEEIRELERRRQYFQRLPRAVTPIAVPLRDVLHLTTGRATERLSLIARSTIERLCWSTAAV